MSGDMAILTWCDLAGLARCRAIPLDTLDKASKTGVGWAAASQAILPYGGIAENPWGPLDEVRQIPVAEGARLARGNGWPSFNIILTKSMDRDGNPWDCCPRNFCETALAALEKETGWRMFSAFEFEFTRFDDPAIASRPVYTLDAFRSSALFLEAALAALREANLAPETIEPEFGAGQLEIACGPAIGIAGPDRCFAAREVLREVARRLGIKITFSPKHEPDMVGNGQHVHFSFVDAEGRPTLYDPDSPALINATAGSFVAGIMRHMPALCAVAAPAPLSYLRLGPMNWSCGYASFGLQNREAAVRVCPPASREESARAKAINLEFRPPDGLSNPYLLIGMLAYAGLAGIKDRLPLPPMVKSDPGKLTDSERAALGIKPLPSSLGEALDALIADHKTHDWMSPTLLEAFISIKRAEIEKCSGISAEETCVLYRNIY